MVQTGKMLRVTVEPFDAGRDEELYVPEGGEVLAEGDVLVCRVDAEGVVGWRSLTPDERDSPRGPTLEAGCTLYSVVDVSWVDAPAAGPVTDVGKSPGVRTPDTKWLEQLRAAVQVVSDEAERLARDARIAARAAEKMAQSLTELERRLKAQDGAGDVDASEDAGAAGEDGADDS